ncbi:MAG: DNA polymerase III subunit beta [Candidatus Desulfofervidus auxilii]|nr:DNA polymerase III subunit beta [Candidatus Desulfofervidus auxilii]
MKLIVERQNLYSCLQKIRPFIGKKTTMPILSHILLEARENELIMMATDLELAFKGSCPAEVFAPGQLPVPGKTLYDFVRTLEYEKIELKENENHWLEITGGNSYLCLATLPPDEFPTFPEIEHFHLISFPGELFRKAIMKTYFSMAKEDVDTNLAGLCLEKQKDKLCFVSTDTYRLSYMEIPYADLDLLQFDKSIMLPRKAVLEILRLCSTGMLQIGFDNSAGVIKTDGYIFYFRLKENKFPEYHSIIPKKSEYEAKIPKRILKDILKRTSVLIADKFKVADFLFYRDRLIVRAENPAVGKIEENLDIEFSGDKLKMAFNISFLLDILNVMDSEEFIFGLNTERTPCVITGKNDIGFKALIMPVIERE